MVQQMSVPPALIEVQNSASSPHKGQLITAFNTHSQAPPLHICMYTYIDFFNVKNEKEALDIIAQGLVRTLTSS